MSSSVSRLRDGAREAVEQEALAASSSASRLRTMSMVTSSGTRSPASMYALACRPERGPLADVGPEDVAGGDLRHRQVLRDELGLRPLARAGWPDQDEAALAQEAFVVAQHQLALDLLHGLEADADHDEHRGAAEREGWLARRCAWQE